MRTKEAGISLTGCQASDAAEQCPGLPATVLGEEGAVLVLVGVLSRAHEEHVL